MTTILVIDDDAEAREFVRMMAPTDWTVLEAPDGLIGLEIVRCQLGTLDLVVLDLNLPYMSGRSVCANIRQISHTLPILPFTGLVKTTLPLASLGCLEPVGKPVRPDDLRAALVGALQQPAPQISNSPLVGLVQEQGEYIEALVQQLSNRVRVAMYASSKLSRSGLRDLLQPLTGLYNERSIPGLRRLLSQPPWTALVSVSSDYEAVLPVAREYGVPLILIGAMTLRTRVVDVPEVACLLSGEDHLVQARLLEAIEALAAGGEPGWHEGGDEESGAGVVPLAVARRFTDTKITERQLEVLWLDYQGLSASQIADRLHVEADSLDSYWKRAKGHLAISRNALRAWVRERLAGDPGDPR